jgi:hypothetical protein
MTSLGVSDLGTGAVTGAGADAVGAASSADDGGGGGQTMVAFGDEYGADVATGGAELEAGGAGTP